MTNPPPQQPGDRPFPYREATPGELLWSAERECLRQSDGGAPAQARAARVERVRAERREETQPASLVGVHRGIVQDGVHVPRQLRRQPHWQTLSVGGVVCRGQ